MLCTLIGAIILSINIQVGVNMHLYDDIGDASSSPNQIKLFFERKFYKKTINLVTCQFLFYRTIYYIISYSLKLQVLHYFTAFHNPYKFV